MATRKEQPAIVAAVRELERLKVKRMKRAEALAEVDRQIVAVRQRLVDLAESA